MGKIKCHYYQIIDEWVAAFKSELLPCIKAWNDCNECAKLMPIADGSLSDSDGNNPDAWYQWLEGQELVHNPYIIWGVTDFDGAGGINNRMVQIALEFKVVREYGTRQKVEGSIMTSLLNYYEVFEQVYCKIANKLTHGKESTYEIIRPDYLEKQYKDGDKSCNSHCYYSGFRLILCIPR